MGNLETDASLNKLTKQQQKPIEELNYGRTETDNLEQAFQAAEQRRRYTGGIDRRLEFKEQRAAQAAKADSANPANSDGTVGDTNAATDTTHNDH